MTRAVLINGKSTADATHAIDVSDRGLNYGDGVFETMLLRGGRVRFLAAHLDRLTLGCERLGIACPSRAELASDLETLCRGMSDGVVKIVVTRGAGARGYRPVKGSAITRITSIHELAAADTNIRVRWCDMRLSRNPALAGIKHLNRLEQVMAQSEWNDPQIHEGLMLDSEGEVVCGTATNLFVVRGDEIATPDLRYCGVRGVMRAAVIDTAMRLGIAIHEEPIWPEDVETASELFVTNAVRGIRSITALEERTWASNKIALAIAQAIDANA